MFTALIERKFATAPPRIVNPTLNFRISPALPTPDGKDLFYTMEGLHLQVICCSDRFVKETGIRLWELYSRDSHTVAVRSKNGTMGLLWMGAEAQDDRESVDILLTGREYDVAVSRWRSLNPLRHQPFDEDFFLAFSARGPTRLAFAEPRPVKHASTPVPVWPVDSGVPAGTVGSCVKNAKGVAGVVVARHVWDSLGQPSSISADGVNATYVSDDPITDSCFFSIAGLVSPTNLRGVSGTRKSYPHLHSSHEFEGALTGHAKCTLMGADPFCHIPMPGLQQKVYTNAVIQSGDSGAALIDCATDEIVGFAFGYGDPRIPGSYDIWIWAESVYSAHGLSDL